MKNLLLAIFLVTLATASCKDDGAKIMEEETELSVTKVEFFKAQAGSSQNVGIRYTVNIPTPEDVTKIELFRGTNNLGTIKANPVTGTYQVVDPIDWPSGVSKVNYTFQFVMKDNSKKLSGQYEVKE